MYIFRFFIPEGDGEAGGNMGGEAAPPVETPPADASIEEEAETGSVTPEDVAKAMGLPTPAAKEPEEGDDNGDKPDDNEGDDAGVAGAGNEDDATGADESGTPADEPAGKPETDEGAEGDKPADTADPDAPDFSITVEDIDGVSYKIESLADLPEDFKAQNDRQALEILDQLRDARDERRAYEADQAEKTETAARDARVAEITAAWDSEFDDLAADKLVQPGDTERKQQIIAYIGEQNTKRSENGRPLIASLTDAYYGLKAQEDRAAAEKAAKDAKDTARRNGSMVGGSSAPATAAAPVYKPGSARNSDQALRRLGLL